MIVYWGLVYTKFSKHSLDHNSFNRNSNISYLDVHYQIKSNQNLSFNKSKEEIDRNKDIGILEQIVQSIIDYENNQSNVRQTLIKIGELFGQISYNDLGDKDSRYIRNRYGYIRRNKNKSIDKKGLYFERLYHINSIATNDRMYLRIPQKEVDDLAQNLSHLKQRLIHIIIECKPLNCCENLVDNMNIDCSTSISGLTEFSKKYYEPMILERIVDELNLLDSIDFSCKDDRYYFARAFCIIGELFNEYLEDQSNNKQQKSVIIKSLKFFVKLRDQLIHNNEKIKCGFATENQSISEQIIEIKHHLNQVIVNAGNCVDQWFIDISYGDGDRFYEGMKQFLKNFSHKSKKEKTQTTDSVKSKNKEKNPETPEIDAETQSKLNRLISRASGIIEGTKAGVKVKVGTELIKTSIEGQLGFLNEQYQKLLIKLEPNNRDKYPPVLDVINKDVIKRLCNVDKVSVPSSAQISPQTPDPRKDKTVKLIWKIQAVKEEIDYLNALEKLEPKVEELKTRKFKYIKQYIVATIGQFVRDIQEIRICELSQNPCDSDVDYLSKYSHFKKISSSVLINEGMVTSKDMRNRGLAHNIWCFEDGRFLEGMKEIMSVYWQFSQYYYIFVRDMMPMTGEVFYLIGNSFFCLELFEEAIDYYEKALTRFREFPHEAESSDESDNEVQRIFQMEHIVLRTHIFLMMSCLKCGFFDRVSSTGEFLQKLIRFDQISCNNIFALDNAFLIFHCLSKVATDSEYSNPIIEQLETLSTTNQNIYLKFYLGNFYLSTKNYPKAKIVYKRIYQEPSTITTRFEGLINYVTLLLNDPTDDSEKGSIIDYIDELETLLEENLTDFKAVFGDGYLLQREYLVIVKLTAVTKHNNIEKIDGIEIRKMVTLSNQFKHLISNPPDPYRGYSSLFTSGFLFFMRFFLQIAKEQPRSKVESLNEAEYYFDLITDHIERFPGEISYLKPLVKNSGQMICLGFLSSPDLSHRNKIDHITKFCSFHHFMNSFELTLLICLGKEYFFLAEEYSKEYYNGNKEEIAALALNSYDNAVNGLHLALEYPQILGDNLVQTKLILGHCLRSRSLLQYDPSLLMECVDYWNQLLSSSPEIEEAHIMERKKIIENSISQIKSVLNEIVDETKRTNELQYQDEYVTRYLKKKFEIEITDENNVKRWIYRGILAKEELENQIKQELVGFEKAPALIEQ